MLAAKQSEIDSADSQSPEDGDKSSIFDLNELLEKVAAQVKDDDQLTAVHFSFPWNGVPFACQLMSAKDSDKMTLNLVADLGHIPYSGENRDRRQELLKVFLPLVSKGNYVINARNHIQMIINTDFANVNPNRRTTARQILDVITITLLDIKEELRETLQTLH